MGAMIGQPRLHSGPLWRAERVCGDAPETCARQDGRISDELVLIFEKRIATVSDSHDKVMIVARDPIDKEISSLSQGSKST